MLVEQPAKLALPDAEPVGESADVAAIERAAFDQRQRTGDGVGGPAPGAEVGRGFRAGNAGTVGTPPPEPPRRRERR